MDVDLRLVRYAVALADELHFGKAAGRLGITEQTLSAQIKHFEEKLGTQLFVRDRRHVELTTAGGILVERGRRLLADAQEMMSEINLRPLPLRIDVVAEDLATPMLITERVLTSVEGGALEIWEGRSLDAAVKELVAGQVDIAFGCISERRALPRSLAHILVRLQPIQLLLPANHHLAAQAEIRSERLSDMELVIQAEGQTSEWQSWQESVAASFGCKVAERIHGHGRRGVALTVRRTGHPTFTRLESPPNDDLVLRPLVDPVPVMAWSMLWRAEHSHPRIRDIVELVKSFASEQGWLIPPARDWWTPS